MRKTLVVVVVVPKVGQALVDKRPLLLTFFLLCLIPAPALAQDMSVVYLGDIFGRVSTILDPPNASPILAQIYRMFNYGLLTIGSLVLSYLAIMTSVQTAREGSFMGQEWGPQAAWIPLKAIVGVMLLLPLPDGYCGAQVLVIKLLLLSVDAANVMWGTVLDNYEAGNTLSTPSVLLGAEETAESLHRLAMCGAFYNYPLVDGPSGTMTVGPGARPYCGTIILSSLQSVSGGPDLVKTTALQNEEKRIIRHIFNQVLNDARIEFSNPAHTDLRIAIPGSVPLRTERVWFEQSSIVRTLGFIRSSYDDIRSDARFQNATTAVQQASALGRDRGWFFAASFYSTLTKSTHSGRVKQPFSVRIEPHPHPTNPNGDDDNYFRFSGRYSNYLSFLTLVSDSSRQQESLGNLGYQTASGMGFYQTVFGGIFTKVGQSFINSLTQSVTIGGRPDPILSLSETGSTTMLLIEFLWMTAITILMGILVATCFMTMLNPACAPFVAVARIVINLLNWFIVTTWSGLVLIGIYAPMIPFLTFFFGTVQWLILGIESVTAAPLIALTLASPSGDTWGKAQASVLLFLNLMLRPTLMVIGFVLGARLSVTFFEAFNFAFHSTLASQVGNMGIFGVVAIVVMYTMITIALLNECFSLIHVLPDRTIRWIGGQVEQSGQRATQLMDTAQQGAKTGAESASKAAQAGTMLANKLMDKLGGSTPSGESSGSDLEASSVDGTEDAGSSKGLNADPNSSEDGIEAPNSSDMDGSKKDKGGQNAKAKTKEKPKKPATPGGSDGTK